MSLLDTDKDMTPTHTLESAVELCREIEPHLAKIGYHCGLTGSCLYKGSSFKDVDVILYPHQVKEKRPKEDVLQVLSGLGFVPRYQTQRSCVDKDVLLLGREDRRVDCFFLS